MNAQIIAIVPKEKSVAKVLRQSKTTSAYWLDRVFRKVKNGQASAFYYAAIQHAGRREFVSLATGDKDKAASAAAKLYSNIRAQGWDAALAAHDPERAKEHCATLIGDIIEKINAAGLRPRTASSYIGGLRWFGARALQLKASKKTFGPAGSTAFRAKIDALPLEKLTPELIRGIIARKIQEAKGDVRGELSARISVNQFLRNAKAALAVAESQGAMLPKPRPFDGIAFLKDAKAPTYRSKINPAELLRAAKAEFETKGPKAYLGILLALGAGLRRGEIEHLTWGSIDGQKHRIDVSSCAAWRPKTAESESIVHIDPGLSAILETYRAGADDRVTDGPALDDATAWLRSQGIAANKPLHELRKEFGSIVYASSDLLAASKQLRHASLAVTASTYIENRKHVAPQIGAMLAAQPEKKP